MHSMLIGLLKKVILIALVLHFWKTWQLILLNFWN